MDVWIRSKKAYATLGGDPVWECPKCGFEHVYGIQNDRYYRKCPECGNLNKYPWEKVNDNEDYD